MSRLNMGTIVFWQSFSHPVITPSILIQTLNHFIVTQIDMISILQIILITYRRVGEEWECHI